MGARRAATPRPAAVHSTPCRLAVCVRGPQRVQRSHGLGGFPGLNFGRLSSGPVCTLRLRHSPRYTMSPSPTQSGACAKLRPSACNAAKCRGRGRSRWQQPPPRRARVSRRPPGRCHLQRSSPIRLGVKHMHWEGTGRSRVETLAPVAGGGRARKGAEQLPNAKHVRPAARRAVVGQRGVSRHEHRLEAETVEQFE